MTTWQELGDHLYRAITGGRSPRTEGFHSALGELRRQVPSTTDLAARIGFPRKTVADWLNKGSMPRGARREEAHQTILEALRRHRLRLGREARLRGAPDAKLVVEVKQRYHDKRPTGQHRTWKHPQGDSPYNIEWDPRANGRIIDAYLAGDMEAAAEEFIRGIGDQSYQEMTTPDNDDDDVHFDIERIELE